MTRTIKNCLLIDAVSSRKHFSSIANDIKYPPLFSADEFFSSVLRIGSANTQLWTHYDIMDNVLIQVRGTKRLIMFSPSDIDYLYIDGDKSLVNNIEEPDFEQYPLVRRATYLTGTLQAGDCLFIPGSIAFLLYIVNCVFSFVC
jgi:tRNA wybutosine-synthesizing protein 5